ncbi:MAG: histidine phosphatase family protein [Candidatus Micrarchaeota archaeon]|nr:histidine phosphatase family protein [Candidatus Micrarchaeota archaeon]
MNFTMILRHADREHFNKDLSNVFTANLLAEGKLRAHKMGRMVRKQFGVANTVYTSIAPRCYHTGVIIAHSSKGFVAPVIECERSKYGDFSGGFLKEGMMESWVSVVPGHLASKRPYRDIMRGWVESGLARLDRDGYAEHILSKYIMERNILAITHDTTVAPLAEYLAEKWGFEFTSEMYCPPFLTGLCLLHDAGALSAIKWIRPPPVLLEAGRMPLVETLWEKR